MALQTWLGPPRAQGLPRESGQPELRLSPAPPGRPTLGTPASSWAVSVSLRPGWWPRALPLCDRNQLRRRLCLALPGSTLFGFPCPTLTDLVSLGALRVTNSVTTSQEVKRCRQFRDRRPRTKNPVLVPERGLGLMPIGRHRRPLRIEDSSVFSREGCWPTFSSYPPRVAEVDEA